MRPGYRWRYTSQDIYWAVLGGGIDGLDAFETYLQATVGCDLDG
jgi:hypothetical protein